jgi:uncharacterized protein (TIGR00255 family)
MILSMTGYGRGRGESEGVSVAVEIRSVNGKGRDVRLRLPPELLPLEAELREVVQRHVARGRIDVFAAFEGPPPSSARYRLNRAAAEEMLAAWRSLRDAFELADPPTAQGLLSLPGVIEPVGGAENLAERLEPAVRAALAEALAQHRAAREREGAALGRDLAERAALVTRLVGEIKERVAGVPERLAREIRERIEKLLGEVPVDEQRVAQEIAIAAQRADVNEEVVRLDAHLERLAAAVRPEVDEPGRTLEFLVQEIRREVNTLASKCGAPEIDERVLAIRGELERIREQAANVE